MNSRKNILRIIKEDINKNRVSYLKNYFDEVFDNLELVRTDQDVVQCNFINKKTKHKLFERNHWGRFWVYDCSEYKTLLSTSIVLGFNHKEFTNLLIDYLNKKYELDFENRPIREISSQECPELVSYGEQDDDWDLVDESFALTKEKILKEESELPINVRRRINYDEENIINLLKKFALRHSGLNKKIYIIVRLTCKDVAYELLDATQAGFGDKEFMYVEDVLTEYLEEKYGEQLKEFIENFFNESGNELGSRYVFEKHSERNGGNGFSEGYETWNLLLKNYASWFPDLDWKELKQKLDNMKSGGKILIKKPGDKNNVYNYYFSLQRFDI